MSKYKLAVKFYKEVFDDNELIRGTLDVIEEVITSKWPDNTIMSMFYNVGDLKKIAGFWNDEFLLKDIIDTYQARCMRGCFAKAGINTNDINQMVSPLVMKILADTGIQRDRIAPMIRDRANKKHNIAFDATTATAFREKVQAMQERTFTDTKL